ASARGALREPGQTTMSRSPPRWSSWTRARAQRVLREGTRSALHSEGAEHEACLHRGLRPLALGGRPRHAACSGEETRGIATDECAAKGDAEVGAVRSEPADGPGVPAAREPLVGAEKGQRLVPWAAAHPGGGMQPTD